MSNDTRQPETVTSVSSFLKRIEASKLTEKWGSHVRVWFRGHANQAWQLEPGVYRMGVPGDEDAQIKVERHLTQDFRSFGAKLLTGHEQETDIYFIQQHYRMPTRLLDWSGNPLAALYFATTGLDDLDGEVFMLDSYGFDGGHMTSVNMEYRLAMGAIFAWDEKRWPNRIMAVRPPAQDPRIIAQSGYFTFHPRGRQYLTRTDNDTLRSHLIPKDAKAVIRRELNLMNVNEFTIYGGLDHLANWLRESYTKITSVTPQAS